MKVETHNHPSAIEPYGGAGTGIGGVIRDILGTGLGAQPVANTDVFCFGPPDLPRRARAEGLPAPPPPPEGRRRRRARLRQPHGHPHGERRDPVRRRATSATRWCTAAASGVIPRDARREGGAPGRPDRRRSAAARAATASTAPRSRSVELHAKSETVSSGAVQIGDAITEKKVLDVLLAARDRGPLHARSPTAAPAGSRAPSARWAPSWAPRSTSPRPRSSTRACAPTRSGSARRRSAWCRRAAEGVAALPRALRGRGRRGRRARARSRAPAASCCATARPWSATSRWSSSTTACPR